MVMYYLAHEGNDKTFVSRTQFYKGDLIILCKSFQRIKNGIISYNKVYEDVSTNIILVD